MKKKPKPKTRAEALYESKLKALPYWPSKEFIEKSLKSVKENGMIGTDEHVKHLILKAYWQKRAQILAKIAVPK